MLACPFDSGFADPLVCQNYMQLIINFLDFIRIHFLSGIDTSPAHNRTLKIPQELDLRVRGLVTAVPAAEGVHDGYDRDPDGIDRPGREAAGRGGGTKLERAEADLCEVESLGCGDDEDEQVDEVEVDDEIEKRDAAEDE